MLCCSTSQSLAFPSTSQRPLIEFLCIYSCNSPHNWGLSLALSGPWKDFTPSCSDGGRLAPLYGECFTSANGILQGCPLSLVLLNMLVHVWVVMIQRKVPAASPSAYADDLGATATSSKVIRRVLKHTQGFCSLTGMLINAPKSGVWATSRRLRLELATTCTVDGAAIPLVMDERHLGAFVSFTKRKCRGRIDQTEKACSEVLERICSLQLHLEARAHLVASMVLPKALYAGGVSCPSQRSMKKLRAKCARAVWGQGNRWRAVEAMFSLLTKGHITDPVQKFAHDCIVSMRRVLRRRPQLIPLFGRVLEYIQENHRDSSPGPVAALLQACDIANLSFEGPERLFYLNEENVGDLMETDWLSPDNDSGAFLHMLRESIRIEQWSVLAYRRGSFFGAQSGVDRAATLELHKQLSGLERYKLRTILCGAVNTRSRTARILDIDPTCICCQTRQRETAQHVFAECDAHEHLRHTDLTLEEWQMLPNCLKYQGIVPRDDALLPERFRGPVERKQLGCTVQHNLLDIWDHRNALSDAPTPQPRWGEGQQNRNVRRRLNEMEG